MMRGVVGFNCRCSSKFGDNPNCPRHGLRMKVSSSSPSYTLKEIEALAWVFVDGNDASGDQGTPDAIKLRMFMGAFVAWLAKREREGLDASD